MPPSLGIQDLIALLLCFGAFATLVYRSALDGPFVSDDVAHYFSDHNPYLQELNGENLAAILHPGAEPARVTLNYAPVHLLLLALEWQVFGPETFGYHAVNLILHVANSVLLAALLISSGVPRAAGFLGGGLFLLHPANVEAVAWISQLKSTAAVALGLGAVLALGRRPLWATLLFAAALLTKSTSLAFLVMAAGLAWCRPTTPRTWRWLGVWLGLVALMIPAQLAAFGAAMEDEALLGFGVRLRTVASFGARYLWMAMTGLGVSAFHEPPAARSPLDPWALAGFGLGLLLAGRALFSLLRHREEGAYWLSAAAAFAPVSQLVSFRFPFADRYLYFMLPGLIGASALMALRWRDGLESRFASPRGARVLSRAGLVLGAALALVFALHAAQRAPLWNDELRLWEDAARHYPEGSLASYIRAVSAARRGDADEAVAELRAAQEKRHLALVIDFAQDPRLGPIRHLPVFHEFVLETARFHLERARRIGVHRGGELTLAHAHRALGQTGQAIAVLEEFLRRYPDDRRRPEALALLEELRGALPDRGPR